MINKIGTEDQYRVIAASEQTDGSIFLSLDKIGDLQTTAMGCLYGKNGLQEISNKFWDQNDLEEEYRSWLK